jgi:cell division protein FtsQ
VLRALGAVGLVLVLTHLPWERVRKQIAVLTEIRVEGVRYLDAARVSRNSGLRLGQDLIELSCARARQALLLNPRIERAEVSRLWPRGVRIRIVERMPVLLVRRGSPWELDSSGVLLAPLTDGVVADVPLLAGVSFEGLPAGARVSAPEVRRGLAWVQALSASELKLTGHVSEVEVSDPEVTGLLLMDGTRVVGPGWPPTTRVLSALRVVLADLERRGITAREVDLRFRGQVIVRPADPARPGAARMAEGLPTGSGGGG